MHGSRRDGPNVQVGPREAGSQPRTGQEGPRFERSAADRTAPNLNGRRSSTHTQGILVATPQALGQRILATDQDRILIVRPGCDGGSGWPGSRSSGMWGEPVAYMLDDSGRWNRTPDPWRDALTKQLAEMETDARLNLDHRPLTDTLRSIQAAHRSNTLVKSVRLNLSATANLEPDDYPGLTRCTADDLDSDLRYLGCNNGVVDLQTGALLARAEGRKHLVTRTTGVAYRPSAEPHADVERLFAHLKPEVREWYWDVMAHALHGRPARRLYLIVGPPGGGKTQMAQALIRSLGDYVREPMDSALTESGRSGQHNTEVAAFAHPVRVCIMDEVNAPGKRVSPALLKRLSGDGRITYRRLHENPQTRDATATLFVICNHGSVPRLHLEDEAMQERLRELPYPSVPDEEKDPDLPRRLKTRKFREAFLTRLIKRAAKLTPGRPPTRIPTVAQATARRVTVDIGEIGTFARRIRPADGKNLTFAAAWGAWCAHHSEETNAPEAGGLKRIRFSRRLQEVIPTLPMTKPVRMDGKTVRGWQGWELTADGRPVC